MVFADVDARSPMRKLFNEFGANLEDVGYTL